MSAFERPSVDLLIVTALSEELGALQSKLENFKEIKSSEFPLTYLLTELGNKSQGTMYSVAVTCLFEMGNASSGVLASGAIRDLKPNYVIMFGLAGGIKNKTDLCDVIVSTQIFYYEQAKLHPNKIEVRPTAFRSDFMLKNQLQHWATQVEKDYAIKFGPFAVGEKIIANSSTIENLKEYEPKLLGVEMESYGVAYAASLSSLRPRFIAIRGVSDHADELKNDDCREQALFNAADFLIDFLQAGVLSKERVNIGVVEIPKTMIAIHHLSMDRRSSVKASLNTNLLQLQNCLGEELAIDQTEFFQDGSLMDPYRAFELQRNFIKQLDRHLQKVPEAHIGYFGLAHIPFIFHLGYEINRRKVRVFPTNRQTGEWQALETGADSWPALEVEGMPSSRITVTGDVIVRVSISSSVALDAVGSMVTAALASIHLSVAQPGVDLIVSDEQLNDYTRIFQQTVTSIQSMLPCVKKLHIFYAGPPTLAFRCGQQVSKTFGPDVIVYNYSHRDRPNYRWALNIHTGDVLEFGAR